MCVIEKVYTCVVRARRLLATAASSKGNDQGVGE